MECDFFKKIVDIFYKSIIIISILQNNKKKSLEKESSIKWSFSELGFGVSLIMKFITKRALEEIA